MVTWVQALTKARKNVFNRISRILSRSGSLDDVSLEELEERMLQADLHVGLVTEMIDRLEKSYQGLEVSRKQMLREMLVKALPEPAHVEWRHENAKPWTVLIVGVNGSGKTTTCAKLANLAMQQDCRVVLGATDTFRAAGSDQLRLWAERIGCPAITGKMGADAAAVAYDTLDSAISRESDVAVIDTAGRMHTRKPLMDELKKLDRALAKRIPEAPHEVWIVLDASIGQNALSQARFFHQVVPLTGVIVSKLDGSSKAGFLFSVSRELNVPILYAGLGEDENDLVPFDPAAFVDALLGDKDATEEQHDA